MEKADVLRKVEACGVVAVVRAENGALALRTAEACVAAGIVGIEVAFTVPGAADTIKALCGQYRDGPAVIGAGTVLDPETARAAILAGARFVVSPCLNVETVKLCNRYQVAVIPGAMTIKEVVACMEAGADIVKLFPGSLLGPQMVKAIKGPLPQARLMPTGGVNAENAGAWIKAGCVAVGAGGELTKGAQTGDFEAVAAAGKALVGAVRAARTVQAG